MLIQAVTIFPEMFDSITRYGVTGRANRQGIRSLKQSIPESLPTTDWATSTTARSAAARE